MKADVTEVSRCDRCPHRYSQTSEYPSDHCRITQIRLDQDTTAMNRMIPIPDHCPLRKGPHVVHTKTVLKTNSEDQPGVCDY